jgi:hypothetical protein
MTIVSQLIVAIPGMREHVGDALYKDRSLPSLSLEAQLEALIAKPFEMARSDISEVDFLYPKLIILDGLDECGDSVSHQSVLQLFLAAVNQHNLPFSFLIASRPEQKIREAFDESTMGLLTMRLVLDDKYLPDEDIRAFLVSRFKDIKQRHPSRTNPGLSSWPSEKDIERLVARSSGQFIYASTVIKFIDSHRHWPPDRLDIIFGILPCGRMTPFAEMDALYSHILFSASDNIDKILEIITVMSFHSISRDSPLDRRPTMEFLELFLSYRHGEVLMALSDMHSIISVPSPDQHDTPLRYFHASFGDFLIDRSRSGDFFLDPGVAYRKVTTWLLKEMERPSSSIVDFSMLLLSDQCLPDMNTRYLGEEIAYHCIKSTPTLEFLLKLGGFDMSLLSFQFGTLGEFGDLPQFGDLPRILDAVHSPSRIPEFLVWLHRQVSPNSRSTFCVVIIGSGLALS